MLPLTLDDLLPLEEYAGRRREFFESLGRYLDRYRRVRVGPKVTLVFENRQTLWFRVHEIIRIARLADPTRLQKELDVYNGLLPVRDTLQAALLLDITDETQLERELAPWKNFDGSQLRLFVGPEVVPAALVTNRALDLCIGAAHWVQFQPDPTARRRLADLRYPAHFELTLPDYHHASAVLSDEIRQSLLDDLNSSDRDSQRAA
jgi:hypothetical protein